MFVAISMISEVFLTYEIYLLMRCFFKECRVPRLTEVFAYVILYVMLTMPNLMLGIPFVNFICSTGSVMLITVCYKGSWRTRILSGVFVFVIFTLSESIVALLSGYVNVNLFKTSDYYSAFGIICLPVVTYFIVLIVRNLRNIKGGGQVPASYWIISVTLPVLTVFVFLLLYQQTELASYSIIACTVVLFAINVSVIYLYDHQIESFQVQKEKEILELQNQYQISQLKKMNEVLEKLREQRHDFIKHISMLSYINEQGDRERLADYLGEIQENIGRQQTCVETGNFVIDGILNYKIHEAEQLNILMKADVKVPQDLELSIYDMNVILTNLLDNSIRAVKQLKEREITLQILYSKNRLKILVSNRYAGNLKKQNGRFLTTHINSDQHGYGLKNVEKIVKKYDGIFEAGVDGGRFNVEICLFLM